MSKRTKGEPDSGDFEALGKRSTPGLVREYLGFLRHTRKWWLAPVIVLLLLVALILVLGSSAVAPLIYALF